VGKFIQWLISFLFGRKQDRQVVAEPREDKDGNTVPPPPEVEVPKGPKMFPDFSQASKELYPLAKFVADPDAGGAMSPKQVVIHHTCSYKLDGTISWFKENAVDIHYLIGHDGSVVQMVKNNRQAAHAGKSQWKNYVGLNATAIGIEVVNIGPLNKDGDKFFDCYDRQWKGDVRERSGLGYKYWEPFTKAQEESLLKLCYYLHTVVGVPVEDFIGHYECSPDRKNDPYGGLSIGTVADYRKYMSEQFAAEKLKS
jgi:N-acetyl-anhydromuramyl-L-alanine amidase AmpD